MLCVLHGLTRLIRQFMVDISCSRPVSLLKEVRGENPADLMIKDLDGGGQPPLAHPTLVTFMGSLTGLVSLKVDRSASPTHMVCLFQAFALL